MNILLVLNMVGRLLTIESVALLLPALISLGYREKDTIPFFLSAAIALVFGMILSRIQPENKVLHAREGIGVVAIGWVIFSLVGCIPFVMGDYLSFTDAVFETVSGFTTTGASVLTDVEVLSRSMLFWRSFTHWIGGMGILVFSIAILPGIDVSAIQIIRAESSGPEAGKVTPRVRDTAMALYLIYIGFTVVEMVLLMFGGMDWLEAAVHTFGSVGTGGFGLKNDSMASYNAYCQWIVTIFMLLSSVSFAQYYLVLRGRGREVLRDEETRFFFLVVGLSTLFITADLIWQQWGNGGLLEDLRHAAFQVGSVISTTGFATCDFDQWPAFSKTILFALFFFGGCAGSTAGGPKSIRVLVAAKVVRRAIRKLLHPRAVVQVHINGRTVREETINMIFGFLAIYAVFLFVGTAVVSLDGASVFDSFMATAATLGNVGPGFGGVGPTCNYAQFSDGVTWFLSFLMLAGRLEIYTLLALFFPSFWRN